jgi:hypothetical protein
MCFSHNLKLECLPESLEYKMNAHEYVFRLLNLYKAGLIVDVNKDLDVPKNDFFLIKKKKKTGVSQQYYCILMV